MTEPRSPDFNLIDDLHHQAGRDFSLELFRRLCLSRAFDTRVRQAQIDKDVQTLIYLSVGQESIAAGVSMHHRGAWVLPQHRCHSTYLSFDGRPERLVDELLGLPSGCCAGMGGSPPAADFERRIIGHDGLIGDHVPIAVGVAMAKPEDKVVCFFGDGAAEEDYVLAALGTAASWKSRVLFVCEDNDLSVLTPTRDRRSWNLAEVARAFGLDAVDIADDPWLVAHHAATLTLPALINVRTCRVLWHNGTGQDGPPEWDRFAITKARMAELGLAAEAEAIETECTTQVEDLWQSRLQTRSGN
ncbi:thiamine pyrophosphate-dependent enzyme [Magnetospirillum sp. UT-4]|uniref:thiamine pyrophosphate-dependent enzyme n=1 Tax=Magnetospirillum sp. UT-4 TaxID=2681467 RepID=UPI00137DB9BC|nr:thiamine pyrophosphate-dependent enzyme [Magnetospirillum sp. UT-4]CAA7618426.1 putative Pyruvate dehydrogenase E1 component subunit alpha [Magnetospirillum sp. UT-4]